MYPRHNLVADFVPGAAPVSDGLPRRLDMGAVDIPALVALGRRERSRAAIDLTSRLYRSLRGLVSRRPHQPA